MAELKVGAAAPYDPFPAIAELAKVLQTPTGQEAFRLWLGEHVSAEGLEALKTKVIPAGPPTEPQGNPARN